MMKIGEKQSTVNDLSDGVKRSDAVRRRSNWIDEDVSGCVLGAWRSAPAVLDVCLYNYNGYKRINPEHFMSQPRLLLIEDNYDLAEMLVIYFETHDYEVVHADDGETGIGLARTCFPNLILLDIMLPDMDGYDVCVRLRQMTLTKYIPILFLTQKDEHAHKVRGLQLGVDDYITKPFDIDELRLRVRRSLRRAASENLHESRTGLPTGTMINEEMAQKLNQDASFLVLSYRIEGFAAYQDTYGFVAARQILNHTGRIIQKAMAEHGTADDFAGIVDDEFIVLTHTQNVEVMDKAIRSRFENESRLFYTFIDVEQGGVILNPGTPDEVFAPLMTMSSQVRSLSGNTV